MLCQKAVTTLFVCLCVFAVGVVQANPALNDPYAESGSNPNRDYENHTLDGSVDPFGGKLHLSHQLFEIHTDGDFRLSVNRHYTSRDTPHAVPSQRSLVGLGWTLHFGRLILSDGDSPTCANDITDASDNPVFEMSDGRRVAFRSTAQALSTFGNNVGSNSGAFFVSADRWIARCEASNSRFIVKSPDGTVYTFDKVVMGHGLYVRRIEGRNGAYADIRYYGDGAPSSLYNTQPLLREVNLSDNRQITFDYWTLSSTNVDQALLRRVTYAGNTWEFHYDDGPTQNQAYLERVERPDGSAWDYRYHTDSGNAGYTNLETVSDVYGRVSEYRYDEVQFDPTSQISTVVSRVTVDATDGVDGGQWDFDYDPGHSNFVSGRFDRTTVSTPIAKLVYEHYGYQAVVNAVELWRIGLLKRRYVCEKTQPCPGNPLQVEELEWDGLPIFGDAIQRPRLPADASGMTPYLAMKTIERDGHAYVSKYEMPDHYGNSRRLVEEGQEDRSTIRSFDIKPNAWLIRLPEVEEIERAYVDPVNGNQVQDWRVDRSYDARGNLLLEDRNGVETGYSYDPSKGNLVTETDPRGKVTVYEGHLLGQPQTIRRPETVTERQIINPQDGTVTNRTDGEGYRTSYLYGPLFRVSSINHPRGADETIEWDIGSRGGGALIGGSSYGNKVLGSTTTRGSLRTTTTINTLGKMQAEARRDTVAGRTITRYYRYDATGRLTFESLPNSQSKGITYTYDALGRARTVTYADGNAEETVYRTGNVADVTDADGHTTRFTHRSFGDPDVREVIKIEGPSEAGVPRVVADIEYDLVGNLRAVTQGGVTRRIGYDARFYVNKRVDPEIGSITFVKDDAGNMTARRIDGIETQYGYDDLSRLETIDYADPALPQVVRVYDDNSNLTQFTYGGVVRDYRYDANNNLTGEDLTITVGGTPRSYTVGYFHNPLDHVSRITYPSGREVDFAPNAFGWPTQAGGYVTNAQYYPSGRLASMTLGNGLTAAFEEDANRLWTRAIRVGDGGTDLVGLTYQYHPDGNVREIRDERLSATAWSLQYYHNNWLRSAEGPWGAATFAYDAAGNIQSATVGSRQIQYHYGSANNRLESVSGNLNLTLGYDRYGNISGRGTQGMTYSEAGNLRISRQDGREVHFDYDGDRSLAVRRVGEALIGYFYAQDGQLLAQMNLATGDVYKENVYFNAQLVARIDLIGSLAAPVFTVSPDALAEGGPIPFHGYVATDPEGSLFTYTWDFGDGTQAHARDAVHTFSSQGRYTVTLTVSDGQSDLSASQVVDVMLDPFMLMQPLFQLLLLED